MADIKHRIFIKASAGTVFKALTTREGLAGWWTSDVTVKPDGKAFVFGFRNHSILFNMEVVQEVPDQLVEWKCLGDLEEWTGTKLRFELSERDEGMVQLNFTHANWKTDEKDFPHCNTDWGHLMYYLKEYAEGKNKTPFMK